MSSDIGLWHGEKGGGGDTPFFTTPFSSDPFPYVAGNEDAAALTHANVDWRETEGAHIFQIDLPGVGKEDLKVEVEDDNMLHISGNRVVEIVDENDKWHRVERRRGSFSRRFRLPENANVEEIKCELEHGMLTVEVAKEEAQEQPRNVRYIDVA